MLKKINKLKRQNKLDDINNKKVDGLMDELKDLDPKSDEYFELLTTIQSIEECTNAYNNVGKVKYEIDWSPVWGFAGNAVSSAATIAAILLTTSYVESDNILSRTAEKVVERGIRGK